MPNGFHGSDEEWKKFETPLLRIDDRLTSFAHQNGLSLTRNYHNWPERSLVWYAADIRKLMQIFLESDKAMTFTFWICASADRGAKRLWKQESLKKAVQFEEIEKKLEALLVEGRKILDSWSEHDLALAPSKPNLPS